MAAAPVTLTDGVWQLDDGPIAFSRLRREADPAAQPKPTAVLLHGITTNREIMYGLGLKLSVDHDVICCDLPCHGGSLDYPEAAKGDPATLAGSLLEALRRHEPALLDGAPLLLVGHSFGGLVAAELARHCRGLIGLVLGDVPLTMAKQVVPLGMLKLSLPQQGTAAAKPAARRLLPIIRDSFGLSPAGSEERIYYDLLLGQAAPVLVLRAALPLQDGKVDQRIPSCMDDVDQYVLQRLGGGAITCRILPDTSHLLFQEIPAIAARAIREWLAAVKT